METNMTINVTYTPQPVQSVTLARKGLSAIKVDRAEDSGKIRIKAQKDGVPALLFSEKSAAELVEALNIMLSDAA